MSFAELRCLSGILEGETIELEAAGLTIGRATEDPGPLGGDARLSRRHARITVTAAGSVIIEDLGSTNGTWVNDALIADATPLKDGDEVRVGRTTFAVKLAGARTQALDANRTTIVAGERNTVKATPTDLVLLATDGPLSGREIVVSDELLIGRAFQGDGALAGDKTLSRHHARIARGPLQRFYIEDTGSTNGTFLNDNQLRSPRPLTSGDELSFGASRLAVRTVPQRDQQTQERPGPPRSEAFMPRGSAPSRVSSRRLVSLFAAVFVLAIGAAVLGIVLVAPNGPHKCPPAHPCNPVPKARPLLDETLYKNPSGWSLEYDAHEMSITGRQANEIQLSDSQASGLTLAVSSKPASQSTPEASIQTELGSLEQHVVGLTQDTEPQDQMFGVPAVGFHGGIGSVYGGEVNTAQGSGQAIAVELVAASDATTTILVTALFDAPPFEQASFPEAEAGKENPALQAADEVIETIRFPSDGGAA